MIKPIAKLNLVLNTTLTVVAVAYVTKQFVRRVAETEYVKTAGEYVVVKLARGDYNRIDGFEQMRNDYKFFNIIAGFYS